MHNCNGRRASPVKNPPIAPGPSLRLNQRDHHLPPVVKVLHSSTAYPRPSRAGVGASTHLHPGAMSYMKSANLAEATKIAEARGLEVFCARYRTICTSMDSCISGDLPDDDANAVQEVLFAHARRGGVHRHLVTTFMNEVANENPFFETCQFLTDKGVLSQLWLLVIDLPSGRVISDFPGSNPEFEAKLKAICARNNSDANLFLRKDLTELPSRCRDYLTGEMYQAIESMLGFANFRERAIDRLACQIEHAVLLVAGRTPADNTPGDMQKLGRKLLMDCMKLDSENAAVAEFLTGTKADWETQLTIKPCEVR